MFTTRDSGNTICILILAGPIEDLWPVVTTNLYSQLRIRILRSQQTNIELTDCGKPESCGVACFPSRLIDFGNRHGQRVGTRTRHVTAIPVVTLSIGLV